MPTPGAIGRLYDKAYDFPNMEGEPKLAYMIASIPRSGGTHFGLALWRTGCLGAPLEYVNLKDGGWLFRRLSGGDPTTYWKALTAARTSPNGVFGFKAFVHDFSLIADKYEALLPAIAPSKVIYLRRRDRVAQVLSYARAAQTEVWFHDDKPAAEPEYDMGLLKKAEQWVDRQERQWRSFFHIKKITPLEVFHEDFLERPEATLTTIADFLGVSLDRSQQLFIPEPRKQSDEITEVWRKRYEMDREAALGESTGDLRQAFHALGAAQ
jgi:LPS sulfotransferase NodH